MGALTLIYKSILSPPCSETGVESKIGVWLLAKNILALQLVGTPSTDIENISETKSAGPGVGLEIDML